MKAMKKLFAFALAAIMVMAMGITVFAEEGAETEPSNTATITVKGLYEGTEVSLYELATCDNGVWTLEEWATNAGVKMEEESGEYQLSDADKLKDASLENIEKVASETVKIGETSVQFSEVEAGIYYVKASDKNGKVTYSVMVAQTFDNVNSYATSEGMVLIAKDATVTAKASDYDLTKEADDSFVKRGETVTFTITTIYPTFSAGDTNTSYTIVDTPSGVSDLTLESITIGTTELTVTDYSLTEGIDDDGNTTYTLDLTSTVENSATYAGQTVTVKYTAVVTADEGYENVAVANKGKNVITKDGGDVKGYTGSLIINKIDEEEQGLTGAKFTIKKVNEENAVKVVETDESGVYQVALEDDDSAIEEMSDDGKGTITIKGLDEGEYVITETKAPEGYSINNSIKNAKIAESEQENVVVSVDVSDTKLAALPSTGGIGTTIFTICGVCIMVGAVSLFFVSRKRSAR